MSSNRRAEASIKRRNKNKTSTTTSNKGSDIINKNSGTVVTSTTSPPSATDSGFKGSSPFFSSGEYLTYPLKTNTREDTGDRLVIKCVEYIVPSKAADTRAGISIIPENIGTKEKPKYKRNVQVRNFGMTADARTRQQQKTKYFIDLPIPQDVNDSNSVTWGEDTLNMFELAGLAIGKSVIDSPGASAGAALDAFTKGVSIPTLDNDTQEAFKASISGLAINALGSNVSPRSVVSRSTGQVLNSNLELLFQGVNLRTFPFSINFSPRSFTEGERVKLIIRKLKQSMAAKAGGTESFNGASASGIMIKAPDVFILQYTSNGTRHPFLNSFKTCALTGINVNYTAAGTYATYDNSTPVNIRMDMVFKELNPIYSEDYDTPDGLEGVGY